MLDDAAELFGLRPSLGGDARFGCSPEHREADLVRDDEAVLALRRAREQALFDDSRAIENLGARHVGRKPGFVAFLGELIERRHAVDTFERRARRRLRARALGTRKRRHERGADQQWMRHLSGYCLP